MTDEMLDWVMTVGVRMIVIGTHSGNVPMRNQGSLIVGTLFALST